MLQWLLIFQGITGDIIVGVPSRETLLVADGANEKAVEQLRKRAQEVFASAPYSLTEKLLVRRGSKFEVLV